MPRKTGSNPSTAVTLGRIAELAGTSKSTVSRVLSGHARISETTRAKVLAIVKDIGFTPNRFARALAGGGTGLIGVISSNIGSGFYAEVLRGINLVTSESGSHILCSFAHGVEDYAALATELVDSGAVDAMIVIAPPVDLFQAPFSMARVPTVLCAARAPSGAWSKVDSVLFDNTTAMRDVVDHLVDQGFRHIVHAAGPEENYDATMRAAAFEANEGRHASTRLRIIPGGWTADEGRAAMRRLLRQKGSLPDAIVAFNDSLALGMMEEFRNARREATRVAFTGWDDNPAAALANLTSVRMPMGEMGMRAARSVLLRLGTDEKRLAVPVHDQVGLDLVVRASSKVWA